MGCDIHIVIEERWRGRWVGVRTDQGFHNGYPGDRLQKWVSPSIGQRNYDFFARLAGVRGHGPVPSGIPDDASDLTLMRVHSWCNDGHSHSYLPLEEFASRWCAGDDELVAAIAKERLRGERDIYNDLLYRASIGAYDAYGDHGADDFRAVFWFDN